MDIFNKQFITYAIEALGSTTNFWFLWIKSYKWKIAPEKHYYS